MENLTNKAQGFECSDCFMLDDGKGGFWYYDKQDQTVEPITMGVFCKILGKTAVNLDDLPHAFRKKL